MFRALSLTIVSILAACGGAQRLPTAADFPAERAFDLTSSAPSDEVTAFTDAFYQGSFDREATERRLQELLARHPDSWELHEVAGSLAWLRGDTEGRWEQALLAAADQRCPLTELFLWESTRAPRTVSEINGSMQLLRALAEGHPRLSARRYATLLLIEDLERLGRLEEAEAFLDGLGFLDQWMVIGAFDNDQGAGFRIAHPPEEEIDLEAEVQGRLRPVSWRPVERLDRVGQVPLDHMVSPNAWSVAYLVTWVHVEAEQTAQLRLSTSTAIKVWVNDGLLLAEERLEATDHEAFVVPVTLSAGWNQLLIKSANGDGDSGWNVAVAITDESGATLRGLTQSRDPQRFEAREDLEETAAPLELPLDTGEASEARRLVLEAESLLRVGLERRAIPLAQRLVEASPEHPQVLLVAARVHWDNGELGRAIDLLNQGASRTQGWGAGVLAYRARFYRQRGLLDRAIADLQEAVEAVPEARVATIMLSDLYERRSWHEDRQRVLEGALERWPDSGHARRELASCLSSQGYEQLSEEQYLRAHTLEPGHSSGLRSLIHAARRRQDYERAIELCDWRRELWPTRSNALTACAYLNRIAGRREEAQALLEEARRRDPDWNTPYEELATMAYEEGDDQRALELWHEALERDPDDTRLAERIDFLESDQLSRARELVPTEEQLEAQVTRARQVEVMTGAQTVSILDHEVTTARGDGSADSIVTQVSLAATTDGVNDLVRWRVPRNARILHAYARSPEGERQEASSIRGGEIRFRQLQIGSVVVVQYISHRQPNRFMPNHYSSSWVFNRPNLQTDIGEWTLLLPRGRHLSVHTSGSVEHEHRTEAEHEVHTFSARSVEPIVQEPGMPPIHDVNVHVTVSTVPGWNEFVGWEVALLAEAFESAPELRALAQELTEGATTTRERIEGLFAFVAQEIRYQQDYENSIAGVRPHSSTVVLQRRYGDCKDQAVLLMQLAREAGVESRFALVRTNSRGQLDQETPSQQFNHAIVYFPAQEGLEEGFFLDPTANRHDLGVLPQMDQGVTSLVLDPETGAHQMIPIPYEGPEAQPNEMTVETQIVSATEARGRLRYRVKGGAATRYRRQLSNPGQEVMAYENIASGELRGAKVLSGAHRNHDDIRSPVEIDLELDVAPALHAGQDGELQLPIQYVVPLVRSVGLETRRYPLRLIPWRLTRRHRIELPLRARVVRQLPSTEIEHRCFTVSQRCQVEGRQLSIDFVYEQRCTEVSPEDYPPLREAVNRATNQLMGTLAFELP